MEKKIPVKEVTDDRLNQTEPVPAVQTDNDFLCPSCGNEIIVGRVPQSPDLTMMPQIYNCQGCIKKWTILKKIGQVTRI